MITGRKKEQKCWVTSQNILNNAELQKWYNYDELHAFDIKTNKNVALGRKPFKTTQNYKSDQNTMTCIDLTSKREKMLSLTYVAKQSKPLNYKSDQIIMTCIDLMSKRSKQRKTPNSIKLPWICIDLTSKRSKMLSYVANHSKPLKYKSDQNTMTCTDLMSKTSKQC